MNARGRHFRVGLLVLVAAGLFLGLLLFVLGKGAGGERETYYIQFAENVKGMVLGSKVNFQGVPLGTVRDIRFEAGKTLVELSVDPSRGTIQDVTRARLDRLLVTGQVTVELEGWSETGRSLPPHSYIQPTADPLHRLTRSLPEVMDEVMALVHQLKQTTERVDGMLAGEVGQRLGSTLANLDAAAALLPERIGRTADRLDELLAAGAGAARAVDAAAAAVAGTAGGPETRALLLDARAAIATLQDNQRRLDGLLGEATALLAGLRSPATAAVQSVRTALDEARGLLRTLRLAPNTLLHGIDRPAEVPAAPGGGR